LSKFSLNTGAIYLIEQVLDRLNSTQLGQIEQALKAQPSEEGTERALERLRLNRELGEIKHLLKATREALTY
jgi:hypothetical protein